MIASIYEETGYDGAVLSLTHSRFLIRLSSLDFLMRGISHTPRLLCHRLGFTLIELLVVVSIIALLIAILLPALGRSKETARRAQCMSNQHQLIIAATAAAIDNKANFPTIPGQLGHITWVDEDTYEDFGGRLSPNGNNDDTVRHHQFYCPNRFNDWKRVTGGGNLVRIRTGYQVLLGRGDKPDFIRRENFSEPALAWISTLNIDTPEPGTIRVGGPDSMVGREDLGLLLADINEEGTYVPRATTVAHASNGYADQPAAAGQINPQTVGGEGGNLGFLDGSVNWRSMIDMNGHNNHQSRTDILAWW